MRYSHGQIMPLYIDTLPDFRFDIGKLMELHGESTSDETGSKVVRYTLSMHLPSYSYPFAISGQGFQGA